MGKAGRWLRQLLTGTKERKNPEGRAHYSSPTDSHSGPIPAPSSKEKKRWSFRRPRAASATEKGLRPSKKNANDGRGGIDPGSEVDRRRHAMAVAAATTAAADAALAAAQAAATIVMHLTASAVAPRSSAVEEAAAVKIQAAFRSYLARKALLALKGLVKLQALVRGRLVRKQATATMRCMQALIRVQARTQQHKFRMLEESAQSISHQQPCDRSWLPSSSSQHQHHHRRRLPYENDKSAEDNVKIVEMDIGQAATPRKRHGHGATQAYGSSSRRLSKVDGQQVLQQQQNLAAPSSAPADISLRTYSGRFGECSYSTAQESPQCSSGVASLNDRRKPSFVTSRSEGSPQGSHDHCCYYNGFFPNYMANTESSRAKARSQSAPKQRADDALERSQQVGRRRTNLQLEGRSILRNGCGMQRPPSSHAKPATNLYPARCIKLDRSSMSLGDIGH